MKLLFVHDHKFKHDGFLTYSNGTFPSSIWRRYLSVSDGLTVVGRDGGKLSSLEKNYTVSSEELVDFILLPDLSNIKSLLYTSPDVLTKCRNLVADHDGIIARLPSRMGQLFIGEAVKQGKPYAVEVVGCAWDAFWSHGSFRGKLIAPFAYFKTKKIISESSFALYVTESYLQNIYPCKKKHSFCSNVEIPVVERNVLTARFLNKKKKNGKLFFGLIGNYSSSYKGIDVLINALGMADSRLPDWEVQIVGAGDSGPYEKLAKKLGISSRVKFLGSLPSGDAVYNWLDSVDVYVQPSLTEGLPRALIEAMSRGCPAIASRVGGIPELLESAQMVEPANSSALADALVSLAGDDESLSNLSEANFKKASKYYKPVLEKRRAEFWLDFKHYILSKS
ncbi:glycosyltransferase [Halomonas sp. LC1]|uniref:glycosyltransferase family 4 protein n=1 Tax=Halomonas sp. LC1 TaxID=3043733 RepID=UPI002552FC99|nr:glycosyltransferase [Halomonas sp. LC1]MDK9688103.1 glycosyltransferase [Halomonas sp. LC1]